MINIIVSKNHIEIKGHANYAKSGNDIVCAAVSGLAESVIKSLQGFEKNEVKVKDGEITIDIKHKISKEDQIRLEVLIQGLKMIAKKYDKYVKIKKE